MKGRVLPAELMDWSHSLWAKLMGAGLVFVVLVLPGAYAMSHGVSERVVLRLLVALVGPILLGSVALWARLRRRRWKEYRTLVEHHRPQLEQFFARRGLEGERIAGLIEGVFQRLCQDGPGRRGEEPGPWLLQLASQVYRDEMILETAARAAARSTDGSAPEIGGASLEAGGAPPAADDGSAAEDGEALQALAEALGSLPEPMRACLRLYYERGFSEREVAVLTRSGAERARELLRSGAAILARQLPVGLVGLER